MSNEALILEILLSHNYTYTRRGVVGTLKGKTGGKVVHFAAYRLEEYNRKADEIQYGKDYKPNI